MNAGDEVVQVDVIFLILLFYQWHPATELLHLFVFAWP